MSKKYKGSPASRWFGVTETSGGRTRVVCQSKNGCLIPQVFQEESDAETFMEQHRQQLEVLGRLGDKRFEVAIVFVKVWSKPHKMGGRRPTIGLPAGEIPREHGSLDPQHEGEMCSCGQAQVERREVRRKKLDPWQKHYFLWRLYCPACYRSVNPEEALRLVGDDRRRAKA